ncbi:hypothetical protein LWC34_06205 [Kibdelosporangium philippinense]|uniref:Uncharacterized protein n=1 Tax=Kibdelosporangium philippinense TaxID=211113 RepID=A0ABS8Z703_9PSEU|nr:hypothetical protein [Kibdelosporangium philippinense]MCE7002426.1 hypothetical protein [Kibdelosporangium philippinense]
MGSVSAGGAGSSAVGGSSLVVWRILSALLLVAMGGIHLFLVFEWADGLLGVLFVLNAIGGLILAIGMLVGRFLPLVSVLSLVFMAGTLLGLILALTVGLFGITETMSGQLVSTTLIVESIGIIVLAVTTILAFRNQRAG